MEASRDELARFFETVLPHLNEVQRRVVAGAMAVELGRGGKSAVAAASGMSRNTVIKAQREVEEGIEPSTRQRALGGGEIRAEDKQPGLLVALDELINPDTRGNPMSLLRWTSKSMAKLAAELLRQGFKVTDDTVGRILKDLGYSLQAPSKQKEGTSHPDRDAQFIYLDGLVRGFVGEDQPVISVDTKKKELVREFSNGGAEYHLVGEPTRTKSHDFIDKQLGRAAPYGVYGIANDEGWVSVGNTADTATFAAETGLEITVAHYPPGTSKWNRIEHKMFSFISMNWRGRPLVSYRTIIELISATTTTSGLTIRAAADLNTHPTGTVVTDRELAAIPLSPHEFHSDWNYTTAQTNSR